MVSADTVAQMQVCSQGNPQMVQPAAGFFDFGFIVVYIDPVFMDDPIGTQADDQAGRGAAA